MQITLTNLGTVTPDEAEETFTDGDRLSEGAESGEAHHPAAPSGRLPGGHEAGLRLTDRASSAWSWSGACIPSSMRPCGLFCGCNYPVYRSGLRECP